MEEFTHLDKNGSVRMVDVGQKPETSRTAVAKGRVVMEKDTLERIMDEKVKKGNVLETARIAGVMAAKKTWDLIPMCHPLNITHVQIDFSFDIQASAIEIDAQVSLTGKTGVEMEALTAVSVAALTIYDMCKSYDKSMKITDIHLRSKSGGKSGTYTAQ
ncbi:MAG: cyclic pyranopterin monophosphate synthase MoaC [Proteobacteria bacterium]|nr:cyclic pyranopterin monophosphate synthase MoaC [Pseudomonadota bacterium]MBU1388029.1 cyclic pyranopterin monophosphate synthase MoaC [Pseudomonadota bacterium]MBU1542092.1 cyclic pyranopterin monophosphate synthase MoaC [Pseudomonadota bacterium]MBU2429285.1 cyclic pyranopterin monophosphate synthase MoaC [Pseudomonadota bacterium]MBU2482876.1 cyclic pyranopterin monophosphate synthase MoaC [Pseudomonadota bacterium]